MRTTVRPIQWPTFLINLVFIITSLGIVLPFLLVVSVSFTDEKSILNHGYQFIPEVFSLAGYQVIFEAPIVLLRAYGVTTLITVVGTTLSLLLTAMTGYVISRSDYRYNRIATFYIFFTMLFSGGLVPFYILITQYLHLKDSIWALIIPGLLNPFNIIVMRGFLSKIPTEIIESAKIDGAKEFRIFFTMILPLAKPALATLGLFISFSYWNEWFNALLFIDNHNLYTLQLLLVNVLSQIEFLLSQPEMMQALHISVADLPNLSARMGMAVLVAGPMLCIFPFFQRYFVKGLTVGSLKG
ncbi:carbohydrate ABC transporter permease [Paenibacillus roseipurpureus]|uniref:Carbohydrate ABC transporter permease n=1 Tax=Paenibacillus roseopurpureus TaxID=2918901 RepID=A0AA96RKZ9_9BACL|nr:carbohydrate ABC transporter permease [Paenibacillus sp. MBLB1832]WNR45245.1 carbohydrate ABC transporter permease [Paenibacillus sp. MBLB1832]